MLHPRRRESDRSALASLQMGINPPRVVMYGQRRLGQQNAGSESPDPNGARLFAGRD